MEELRKLLYSLDVLKSISMIDNILSKLYFDRKTLSEFINNKTAYQMLSNRINLWENKKELLFGEIKTIQEYGGRYKSAQLYFTFGKTDFYL